MPYGGVYAKISAAARANPSNKSLAALEQTSFQGTTLRGLLLGAYPAEASAPGRPGIIIPSMNDATARRITVQGDVSDLSLREEVQTHALDLGVRGWVRLTEGGTLCLHVEGDGGALDGLIAWLRSIPGVESVTERAVAIEGHEQFAIRGISAGVFVVQEHQATAHHFDFRLEVDGVMRSWAVPRGPSMDPTVKRLAVPVEDHDLAHNDFEGPTDNGAVIIWDRGEYEQGGRVPWPEALDRGHAVFVLHGEKLHGGFALQRTGGGKKPQWLLVKRRDECARPGSDVAAERPESVQSGRTLDSLLDRGQPAEGAGGG